jgi:hypothetical protein
VPAGRVSDQIRSWGSPLQSFAPHVQPCSVPEADTLLTLENTPITRANCPFHWDQGPGWYSRSGNRARPSSTGFCSARESATEADGLDQPRHVALLGFPPPGCSPLPEWNNLHRSSPHEVGSTDASNSTTPLQGLPYRQDGLVFRRRLPTLLGFMALLLTTVRVGFSSEVTFSETEVRHRLLASPL